MNWKPGTNWHDPEYLFDYFCDRFACEAMSYEQFRDAVRTAKRIVALGAFDDVEEVFNAAEERVWIHAEVRKVYAEQEGRR